jgi:4'-phosphopantetheinyl transferase
MPEALLKTPPWPEGPASPTLAPGEAHVWCIPLDVSEDLRPLLSHEEQERANRFVVEVKRQRFIAGRGQLRSVLARYTKISAKDCRFVYGEFGKPDLDTAQNPNQIRFNMGHSANIGLVAIAKDRRIGVDIEHLRATVNHERIAERFFTPAEFAAIRTLPEDERPAAFLRTWTRKEAYIKALGEGLQRTLASFEVTVTPDESPALVRAQGEWTLLQLDWDASCSAALAVEGPAPTLHRWNAPPHA